MQNEPMLCVQDLSVRFKTKYGSAAAVNHVSFSLKKGEKLGLVGESGSGKSVTSKSIIRLLPTPPAQITGSIRLNGEELLTKTERQMCRVRGNQISMIFQEPMVSLDPCFPLETSLERWSASTRRSPKPRPTRCLSRCCAPWASPARRPD